MKYTGTIAGVASLLILPTLTLASCFELRTAMLAWQHDTAIVSSFLDIATHLSPHDIEIQGAHALAAEKDELTHKAVIDAALGGKPNVQEANNVLVTQGTFQTVVDLLTDMADNGNDDVRVIDEGRCPHVLPAIDMYFAAVVSACGLPGPVTAVRPQACRRNDGHQGKAFKIQDL